MDKIGKYEIIDKIGEGGFGVVYKGKDPFIKRLVAVKTCSSENEAIQQRFFREAEIAGNLHHANVVTIHDFGVEEGTPYLVQEFLTGDDLDVVIKETPDRLTLAVKVRYLKGIAEGLNYAHAQGVIHRDIKPANIRILDNQRVKVMDFGIAKLKDQESQLTQTGMTLGTVAYLSPEQLRGQDVDYRADIFSYGILAYELISGRRPFRADTIHSLFYQLLNDPAENLHELDKSVPEILNEVIQTCLAKDPEGRYSSFSEVIDKLNEVQAEFGDSEDAQSSDVFMPRAPVGAGTTGTNLLAAKARSALDTGDLTAAELTINMARRDYSSEEDFQEHFADLERELESRKSDRDDEISDAAGAASGPSLQDADTLERPPADAKSRDEGTQAVRQRVEALLGEGKIGEAEKEVSSAIAQYGPHTALSDLSRKIRESSNAAVAAPAGGEAATMHIDQATVDAADARAEAEKASASVSGGASSPAQSAAAAPAASSGKKLPVPLIAGAVVLALLVLVAGFAMMSGDGETEQAPTQLADSDLGAESGPADQGTTAGSTEESPTESRDAAEATPEPAPSEETSTTAEATEPERAQANAPTNTPEPAAPERETSAAPPPQQETSPPPARDRTPAQPTELTPRELPTRQPASQSTRRPSTPASSSSDRTSTPQRESAPAATPSQSPSSASRQASEPADTSAEEFSLEDMQAKRAVRSVVDAYVAGWKSRDHDTVNRVFPGADLKKADMRKYRQVDVTVGECNITLTGAGATALCPVSKTLTPRKGDVESVRLRGFELTKSGSAWRIARELR